MALPPLRTELSNTYPLPTNATARTAMGKLYDYVTGLLGMTGNALEARAALGAAASGVNADITQLNALASINGGPIGGPINYFVNGSCQVAQIAAATLSTTAQYGAVDNVMAWCSTGAVTAGTIAQNTASGIGTTGNSFKLSGVTLTGSAVLSVRIRVESKDAVKLKNIASSVAVLVSHDVGAPVNYTVIVRKPTVADNYTATTVISTSSATSVPTGISSATWLKSENIAMGDCSNGIEVEYQIACGAITTKNFEFTEFQIGRGATAVAIPLANYDDTFRRCQWFYRTGVFDYQTYSAASNNFFQTIEMPTMRVVPSLALSGTTYFNSSAISATANSASSLRIGALATATGVCEVFTNWSASSRL